MSLVALQVLLQEQMILMIRRSTRRCIYVEEGIVNADAGFVVTADGATVGTSDTIAQFIIGADNLSSWCGNDKNWQSATRRCIYDSRN